MNPQHRHLIETEGLKKTYKDNGVEVPALRSIDLTIHAGEFTAIVGPSGSGKTTLLNIISGLDKPSIGQGLVGRQRRLGDERRRALSDFRRDHIGFIFQA